MLKGFESSESILGKWNYPCKNAMGQEGNAKLRNSLLQDHTISHVLSPQKLG